MIDHNRPFAFALLLLLLLGASIGLGLRTAAGRQDQGASGEAPEPATVYLALGDSVAAGIGSSRPAALGYGALLADRLDQDLGRPVQRLNLAVPGATTTSLLTGDQLTWALRVLAAARRNDLPIGPITLTIGANDLLSAGTAPDARAAALGTVATNLRSVLTRLRAATADEVGRQTADLVVTGYYDPTGTPADVAGSDGWWLARLDATIAREARRAGAHWVDVAAEFRGRETRLTNFPRDIHPNDAGHEVIAEAIWRALGRKAGGAAAGFALPAFPD